MDVQAAMATDCGDYRDNTEATKSLLAISELNDFIPTNCRLKNGAAFSDWMCPHTQAKPGSSSRRFGSDPGSPDLVTPRTRGHVYKAAGTPKQQSDFEHFEDTSEYMLHYRKKHATGQNLRHPSITSCTSSSQLEGDPYLHKLKDMYKNRYVNRLITLVSGSLSSIGYGCFI
jgi:hypothetical protein